MSVPSDLRYAESHEWLRPDGTVGITDHAQAELTEIVFAELPQVGRAVVAGESFAVVESVKAASDIYAPVSGTVIEVNSALGGDPGLINTDPYGNGWLCKLDVTADNSALLTPEAYSERIGH